MGRRRDESIIGQEFGRLIVLGYSHSRKRSVKSGSRTYWLCLCTLCGQERTIERGNLVSGNSSSCGCQFGLRRQVAELANVSPAAVTATLTGNRNKFVSTEDADRIREIARLLGVKGRYFRDRLVVDVVANDYGNGGGRYGGNSCGSSCGSNGRSLSDSGRANISHEIDHDLVHGI